jgi:hypothetical protein
MIASYSKEGGPGGTSVPDKLTMNAPCPAFGICETCRILPWCWEGFLICASIKHRRDVPRNAGAKAKRAPCGAPWRKKTLDIRFYFKHQISSSIFRLFAGSFFRGELGVDTEPFFRYLCIMLEIPRTPLRNHQRRRPPDTSPGVRHRGGRHLLQRDLTGRATARPVLFLGVNFRKVGKKVAERS